MANKDLFAFLNRPALQAAAVPETSPLIVDESDSRLKEAWQWPTGYPNEKKSAEHSVRFHYRQTNDSQAKAEFHCIMLMYRNHVIQENAVAAAKYPYLDEYLSSDPLGHKKYPDSDVNIYKNATKLVAERVARDNAARDARAVAAQLQATSASAEASATDLTEGESKTQPQKATGPTGKSSRATKKKGRKSQRQRRAAATAAVPRPRVKTDFACFLAKIQRDLYVYLRSNFSRFMDDKCTSIIQTKIATHDREHNLHNLDRLDKDKRYTWKQLTDDTYLHCCQTTTGGFYFLAFYTTFRVKNQ